MLQNKGLASIFLWKRRRWNLLTTTFLPADGKAGGRTTCRGRGGGGGDRRRRRKKRRRRRRRKMKRIIIDRKDRRRVRHNELERPTTKTGNRGNW